VAVSVFASKMIAFVTGQLIFNGRVTKWLDSWSLLWFAQAGVATLLPASSLHFASWGF